MAPPPVILRYRVHVPCAALRDLLVDSRTLSRASGSTAVSTPEVGGAYSTHDGVASGTYTELTPTKIALSWRLRDWAEADVARVVLSLAPHSGSSTDVTCTVSGVPEEDRFAHAGVSDVVRAGWQNLFQGLQRFCGLGMDDLDRD